MKDKKLTGQQAYEQRMRDKGFIKSCYWISPDDVETFSRKAELSREKHIKRVK